MGKGQSIEKNDEIMQQLRLSTLPIPGFSTENEDIYRTVLKKFIRPSILMFDGSFSEIRYFHNEISNLHMSMIHIISGRYGLLRDDDLTIPYYAPVKSKTELKQLDMQTNFSLKMKQNIDDCRVLVIALPSHYYDYLLNVGWFNELSIISTVITITGAQTASKLSEYDNIATFTRKGVARIGKDNKVKILSLIHEAFT